MKKFFGLFVLLIVIFSAPVCPGVSSVTVLGVNGIDVEGFGNIRSLGRAYEVILQSKPSKRFNLTLNFLRDTKYQEEAVKFFLGIDRSKIVRLDLIGINSLDFLRDKGLDFPNLKILKLYLCVGMTCLDGIEVFKSVEYLNITECMITTLRGMDSLLCLRSFKMYSCSRIHSSNKETNLFLQRLGELQINGCRYLEV